jgi:hypothetical protein
MFPLYLLLIVLTHCNISLAFMLIYQYQAIAISNLSTSDFLHLRSYMYVFTNLS